MNSRNDFPCRARQRPETLPIQAALVSPDGGNHCISKRRKMAEARVSVLLPTVPVASPVLSPEAGSQSSEAAWLG